MKYLYKGAWYTPNQLSEISGIAAHTIRDRLRRGYTIEEAVKVAPVSQSVREFNEASHWEDWIGMSIDALHTIYWKWCVSHGYQPLSKQGFSRQLMGLYPFLKTVPTKRGDKCYRLIRMRG